MTVAQKKLCIGLTGRMGSGKGEAVRILEQRGFSYVSLSDIVRREAARAGGETAPRSQEPGTSGHAVSLQPAAQGGTTPSVRGETAPSVRGGAITRGRMQDIGNRLRKEGGAGVLGRLVREQVTAAGEARWVIDGIRNPAEVLELRKIADFFLVGIDCDVPIILERMRQRGRATDRTGERELRAALEREWGRGEPEGGQQVGPTMAMADFTVCNNGTRAELKARLEEILGNIGAEHE
jgi:dephospho-CoA kinase